MTDKPQSNRARTRAIRARMAETGEPWSVAARHHDQQHTPGAAPDPEIAERDWSLRARVRIVADAGSRAPADPWPDGGRDFHTGEELVLLQWGLAGRPVDREKWWTSFDVDTAHIIPADRVEIIEVLEHNPPTFAAAAIPHDTVVAALGAGAETWAEQGVLVVPHGRLWEVRAADGELLGCLDVDRDGHPVTPLQYRAVVIPDADPPRSVPMPTGFITPRPARTADGERIRWAHIPGVRAPDRMRP